MASHRYFKATDGTFTVFRASATRVYSGASFSIKETRLYNIGFTGGTGAFPAVEITKPEYDELIAAKIVRITSAGGDAKYASSPQHSWVRNTDLNLGS